MNKVVTTRNDKLAKEVIKGLESRNMKGYYAADKEEALKIALEIIPKKSSITMGGSVSVSEIGLRDALINGDYNFKAREEFEIRRAEMPSGPNVRETGSTSLADAKEVTYEKIEEPEDQDDMN